MAFDDDDDEINNMVFDDENGAIEQTLKYLKTSRPTRSIREDSSCFYNTVR